MSEYLFFEPPVTSYELSDQLMHHGVKGMKWGVRRYRDKWGNLTPAGRRKRDRLNAKGDEAYNRGNLLKAGKYYAKAGQVTGEGVAELEGSYRRVASKSRKQEIDSRTEWEKKLSEYFSMPKDTEAQRKAREALFDSIDEDMELADISKSEADRNEKRYKALIAKYGDLEPNSFLKISTADEERKTRKQAEYLQSSPYRVKRYEKELKEALAYENQPLNKADKKRMEGKYDSEGRPLLSDWPELTRSDEIKRNIERLKYGFVRHSDELYHHGVKGMKWGIRRYQPYSLIPRGSGEGGKLIGDAAKKVKATAGKIAQSTKKGVSSTVKAAGGAVKSVSDKRKARAEARELNRKARHEAAKQKAIESGSLEDIAKFKKELTHEEIGKALTRIQDEQRIDDMVAKAKSSAAWDRADAFMNKVSKVSGYIGTAANVYQNVTNLKKNQQGLKDFNKSQEDKAKAEANKAAVDKMIKKQQWDKLNEFARKNGLSKSEYDRITNLAEGQKQLSKLTSEGKAKEADKKRILTVGDYNELRRHAAKGEYTQEEYAKALTDRTITLNLEKSYAEKRKTEREQKVELNRIRQEAQQRKAYNESLTKQARYDNSDPKDFNNPQGTNRTYAWQKTEEQRKKKKKPTSVRKAASYVNPYSG